MIPKTSKWEKEDEEEDILHSEWVRLEKERKKAEKLRKKQEKISNNDNLLRNMSQNNSLDIASKKRSYDPSNNNNTSPRNTLDDSKYTDNIENSKKTVKKSRYEISQEEKEKNNIFEKAPCISRCQSVEKYERLNRIEEGSYGVVYRGRHIETGEIVALKRLKLDKEKNGFPITSLREIRTLFALQHPNIVNIREIVIGSSLSQIFIVMDFVDHDLRSLMEDMAYNFLQSEVKTLMQQLLSATAHMHHNWVLHRDLKTSNLLMTNRGMIKIADFGLSRYFGDPASPLTQLIVTLWYRSPEILLGTQEYGTAVDMWSIGCIFAELLTREPLIRGKCEIDQLMKIFELIGMPTEETWPGFTNLPNSKNINFPKKKFNEGSRLRTKFPFLTNAGIDLLTKLLTLDPKKRISAQEALNHSYFTEDPKPKDPALFPTFPSKGSQEKRRQYESPHAPRAQKYDQDQYPATPKESDDWNRTRKDYFQLRIS
ncbi:uncharacterized protein T551_02721 [Pneumocystis jirovecii RU7]|uniref:cyclin-dependent kinase n=1 Tax=Pneumocystis jirovecii (strain RU7) TaxID=1408657 RepID=A0A0W4ZIX0_PNEJ7|nr:uncharacterized protein T551_02721 [Pneumocystis jirovecii RU7]KTW28302.1 hypothetical protein T551_02721 [Pneumocystis jirovecii RU7]